MSLIDNIKFNDNKTKSYFETLINEFKGDAYDRCVLESNLKNVTIRCWIKE